MLFSAGKQRITSRDLGSFFSLGGALKRTARKCVEKQDYEWELWAIPDLDSSHFLATVSAIEVR